MAIQPVGFRPLANPRVEALAGRAVALAGVGDGIRNWLWNAVVYHAVFFTRINPAAWLFAGLFLVQAVLFFWTATQRRIAQFWRLCSSDSVSIRVL